MQEKNKPIIFISHVHEDVKLAVVLTEWLTERFAGGIEFFVSSDKNRGLIGGDEWWDKIKAKLRNADIVFVILSQRALNRPWIYFEAGGAYFLGKRTIPLRIGVNISEFRPPLSTLQSYLLSNSSDMSALITTVNNELDRNAHDDGLQISKKLSEIGEGIHADYLMQLEQQKKMQHLKLLEDVISHSLANLRRELNARKPPQPIFGDAKPNAYNTIYLLQTVECNYLIGLVMSSKRNNIIRKGEELLKHFEGNKATYQTQKTKFITIVECGDDPRGDGRTTSTVLDRQVIVLKYNYQKDRFYNLRAVFDD